MSLRIRLSNTVFWILVTIVAYIPNLYAAQEKQHCRIEGYPHAIECGNFSHQNFEVHWYRVAARVRYPLADSILWMADSLSTPSTDRATGMISALSRMRNQRDFIWIDIRGKGNPSPIGCLDEVVLPLQYRLYRYADTAMVTECWKKIHTMDGVNALSDVSLAHIYEKMRQVLKLQQVTIVAEGRGADIAQAWHGVSNIVRYQVLDSPLMLDTQQTTEARANRLATVLQQVSDACEASVRCNKQFGNLYKSTESLIQKFPIKTQLNDPLNGHLVELQINHGLFSQFVAYMLSNPSRSRLLPMLVHEAKRGNWQPFIGVMGFSWSYQKSNFDHGVNIVEQCMFYTAAHQVSNVKLDSIGLWFYTSEKERINKLCGASRYVPIAPVKNHPINKIPTLVLNGGVNPSLLAKWARSDTLLEISAPGAAAGVLSYGCAKDIAYRFIRQLDHGDYILNPDKLEVECLTKVPYPSMDMITVEQLP